MSIVICGTIIVSAKVLGPAIPDIDTSVLGIAVASDEATATAVAASLLFSSTTGRKLSLPKE